MNEISEVWLFVPGTDERYAVSNFGHLKMLGKKKRLGRTTRVFHEPAVKRLMCFYEDAGFGWSVSIDGRKRRLYRDELMKLFRGIPVEVDTGGDEACRAIRDAGYGCWLRGRNPADDGLIASRRTGSVNRLNGESGTKGQNEN